MPDNGNSIALYDYDWYGINDIHPIKYIHICIFINCRCFPVKNYELYSKLIVGTSSIVCRNLFKVITFPAILITLQT